MRYWIKLIGIPTVTFIILVIAGYLTFGRTVFMIEHPGCFGTCPSYTVWIFHDGTILYRGNQFVAHTGIRFGHMHPTQVQQFAAKYAALIEHLPPIPHSDIVSTDLTGRSIALMQDGEANRVDMNDTDGPRVPLVNGFIDELETAAQIPYWTEDRVESTEP